MKSQIVSRQVAELAAEIAFQAGERQPTHSVGWKSLFKRYPEPERRKPVVARAVDSALRLPFQAPRDVAAIFAEAAVNHAELRTRDLPLTPGAQAQEALNEACAQLGELRAIAERFLGKGVEDFPLFLKDKLSSLTEQVENLRADLENAHAVRDAKAKTIRDVQDVLMKHGVLMRGSVVEMVEALVRQLSPPESRPKPQPVEHYEMPVGRLKLGEGGMILPAILDGALGDAPEPPKPVKYDA